MSVRHSEFLALVAQWDEAIRLVGSHEPGPLQEHLEDSLALVKHIPESARRLVDVGSGGGFPSVVIAIERPDLNVFAVESNQKKWAFLRTVRRELGLTNLHPVAERDDEHRERKDFQPYDVAVSRATFPVPEWLVRGGTLVSPGGVVLAMEGREQTTLPAAAERHPYALGDKQRAIVVARC